MTGNEDDTRASLYVETTIPSYAAARDSADDFKRARQYLTRAFWRDERGNYRLCTSDAVLTECSDGDPDAALRRRDFMHGIQVFPVTGVEKALAAEYQRLLGIPERAKLDCVHLAVCVTNRVDFLLTWNCTHMGTVAQAAVTEYNNKHGLWVPYNSAARNCTPWGRGVSAKPKLPSSNACV
jgi:hypothetical protein